MSSRMSSRVYLFDQTKYGLRTASGVQMYGVWMESSRTFKCKRVNGGHRSYVIPLEDVAALAPLGDNGTARRWVTMGDVFFGKFAPVDTGPPWVHPYRRHMVAA